jgi:diguanylate cyclase (GGDEF)-like protein/PAS domain S-box-containing protein
LGRVEAPFAFIETTVPSLWKTHSTISDTRLSTYQPPVLQMISFFRKLLGVGASAEAIGQENQADLQLMMDNSVDVILRVGPDLLQRYVSPSSLQLFGWTPHEMIGLPAERFVFPEDHHVIAASVARLHAGETDVTARVRILRKDRTKVWVEAKPRLLRDPVTGKPGDTVLVIRDVTEQKRLEDQLSAMALTDGLTGLANRRAFDAALDEIWRRTLREGTQMSLLLLDIDRFKSFNDGYGHLAGDDCLRAVAAAVKGVARRPGDFAARYGGEELAVILPGTDAGGASEVAEEARSAVEALRLPYTDNPEGGGFITVSIGSATALSRVGGTIRMPEGLLLAADGALYKAKHNGRNRVGTALLLTPDESSGRSEAHRPKLVG